nr:MAG TPA: hypothetical protein [Caudoviricetes sp.]
MFSEFGVIIHEIHSVVSRRWLWAFRDNKKPSHASRAHGTISGGGQSWR